MGQDSPGVGLRVDTTAHFSSSCAMFLDAVVCLFMVHRISLGEICLCFICVVLIYQTHITLTKRSGQAVIITRQISYQLRLTSPSLCLQLWKCYLQFDISVTHVMPDNLQD